MESTELLLPLAAHLGLTGVPLAAAMLYAVRRGERRVPVLLAIGLAASGTVGILGFWSYYAHPVAGESFSYFVLFGSILLACWSLYGGRIDRGLLRRLGTPLALWALGSAFLVFLGFVHGGVDSPLATAASRFSHTLPADNQIPLFYAEWFSEHGNADTPPVFPGEWHFSDRPPLQAGYALSQRAFGWDANGLDYQVLGVVLQQLWIVGLWALLVAARVGRVTRALTMVAVLVSSLAIVNGFFVWPKMLPAAMLLAVAALVVTPLWTSLRHRLWSAALIAALCALAMLGHGSSVFGIAPLALIAAYRGLPDWRWLAVGLATGVALMGSWSAFQKYDDPPGNRLTKWTLASVVEIDARGTAEAILDAYGDAGLDGAIDNKVLNFETMIGATPVRDTFDIVAASSGLEEAIRAVRGLFFFYLLPSMGLLLLAPALMLAARLRGPRDGAEWRLALTCFAVFGIGAVAWGLLLFGGINDRTVLHVCSYLLPLLGICGAVVGLRAAFPRFALYFVGVTALLSLGLYAPSLDPPLGSDYSPLIAALAAASLAAFGVAALRSDRVPGPGA